MLNRRRPEAATLLQRKRKRRRGMKASVATTETLASQRSAACSPYENFHPDESNF